MPITNSKQANVVYLPDGRLLTFYNSIIQSDTGVYTFYDTLQDTTATYTLDITDILNMGYRCLQYQNFTAFTYQPTFCPFVLYINGGVNSVLYETNFATVSTNNETVICTFWSTLSNGKTCKSQAIGEVDYTYGKIFTQKSNNKTYYYKYQPANIQKIQAKNISNFELEDNYKNIFCAVKIDIVPMYVSDDNGVNKTMQDVAIIRDRPIILNEEQSYQPTYDFSIQGGEGGGIGQHYHIPHIDGTSFAFAVFHPGTALPQLSWQ